MSLICSNLSFGQDRALAIRGVFSRPPSQRFREERSVNHRPSANPSTLIQDSAMLLEIKKGYHENPTWNQMINKPSEFTGFTVIDGLLCHSTESGSHLLVIPNVNHKGVGIRGSIINNTHKIMGHYGHSKTLSYMRKYYWWATLAKNMEKFCTSCETCKTTKRHTTKPHSLLHNLPIPDHPWSGIAIDFVGPLPQRL